VYPYFSSDIKPHENKQKYKFTVAYGPGFITGLASITQAREMAARFNQCYG